MLAVFLCIRQDGVIERCWSDNVVVESELGQRADGQAKQKDHKSVAEKEIVREHFVVFVACCLEFI